MLKTMILAVSLLPAATAVFGQMPGWIQDPYFGLDRTSVVCGLGSSEARPDSALTDAIAYAYALKDMSSVLSIRASQLERDYREASGYSGGDMGENAIKNVIRSPFAVALMKTYSSTDADMTLSSLSIETSDIRDPDVRIFWQKYADPESGDIYVRAIAPFAAVRYMEFVKTYGGSDAEIAERLKAGPDQQGKNTAQQLSTELRHFKTDLAADNARLSSQLGESAQAWNGGAWRLYIRNLGRGIHAENELYVHSGDNSVAWVEMQPLGGATLTRDGQDLQFLYNKSSSRWQKQEQK